MFRLFAHIRDWASGESFARNLRAAYPSYQKEAAELASLIRETHPHLAPEIGMPIDQAIRLILQFVREMKGL